MPSTYSPIIRTELPAIGEQAGTWGTTVNTNVGTFIEAAIAGTAIVTLPAGAADYTLTAYNGLADEARNATLKITAVLTANRNVVVPALSKHYLVYNATTGAYTVTVKTAAGTGVMVPQNAYMWLYVDGVNVVNVSDGDVAKVIHAAASKATPVDADELALVNSAASNTIAKLTWASLKATLKTYFDTLYGKITSSTGSIVLPASTTANRDGSPQAGYLRYNTSLLQFEGYGSAGWGKVGGGTSGGGTDAAFYENDSVVTTPYNIGQSAQISGATFTNGSANVGMTAHGYVAGSEVALTTLGTLPTNFPANTKLYVIATGLTADVVQLSLTYGGAAIVAGSAGSGVHSMGKIKNAEMTGPVTFLATVGSTGGRLVVV
jgi:hypothetical protein